MDFARLRTTMAFTVYLLMTISVDAWAQEKFFTLEPIDMGQPGVRVIRDEDKKPSDRHNVHALDIVAPKGTPVYPIAPGEIVEVHQRGIPVGTGAISKDYKDDPGKGAGNYIIIKHDGEYFEDGKPRYSSYLHLDSVENVAKKLGAKVEVNQQIGAVGDTGMYISGDGVRRSHLHLQIDTVIPKPNYNMRKDNGGYYLFPVFPYLEKDPRHGDKPTAELTADTERFISDYADKSAAYGASRHAYKEATAKVAAGQPSGSSSAKKKEEIEEVKKRLESARKQLEEMQKQAGELKKAGTIDPAKMALPAQYSEPDNRSPTGRPKVIDTTTNYIAGTIAYGPLSNLSLLATATGFEARRNAANEITSFDMFGIVGGARNSALAVDTGSNASAGNLNWGRWSGTASTITIVNSGTYPGHNLHYVFGSAPTNIPTSGSVTYNPVGGTNPTSSGGGTNLSAITQGTFNSGTIGVNFATRAVTISNLNFSVSTATFNMNGSSTYNSNALFSGSLTGTCTGAACSGAVSGNHIGTLTGPAAAGIALGYQAHTAGTGMVVGAQGFIKQ